MTGPGKLLSPIVHFREGRDYVEKQLWREVGERFGVARGHHKLAVELAYMAENSFTDFLKVTGKNALDQLEKTGDMGIVIVGRPYNVYDGGINLNIPSKLRKHYGVNVIPLDFLPLDDVDISDVNPNMYWNQKAVVICEK